MTKSLRAARVGRSGALRWIAVLAWMVSALLVGCSHKDDGTTPHEYKPLPDLTLRDDSPNLLLTWIDDKGNTHGEIHPADVPADGRSLVRVVVSDKDDGTRDLFYVADLNQKRQDGAYGTHTLPRRDWEAEIEHRREAYLAKIAPPKPVAPPSGSPDSPAPGANANQAPSSNVQVIIYGASWCGPCHQAADYLRSKGIPYVLKDIEEVPGAQAEMQGKLEKAGQRGGSIPVIDVRGQIIVGFSPSAVDRALAKAAGGTML